MAVSLGLGDAPGVPLPGGVGRLTRAVDRFAAEEDAEVNDELLHGASSQQTLGPRECVVSGAVERVRRLDDEGRVGERIVVGSHRDVPWRAPISIAGSTPTGKPNTARVRPSRCAATARLTAARNAHGVIHRPVGATPGWAGRRISSNVRPSWTRRARRPGTAWSNVAERRITMSPSGVIRSPLPRRPFAEGA